MKRSTLQASLAIGLMALLLAGCSPVALPEEKNGTSIPELGAILSLTGPGAGVGIPFKEGMDWKLSELAAEGKPIEVIYEDSQSDPKTAVSAFNNLVEVKGASIIFSTLSSVSMTLKPMAEDKNVLLWADVAHPALTNGSWTLRHSCIASTDARSLADSIIANGERRAGIIYQQDDWGTAYFKALEQNLAEAGITTASQAVDWKAADYRTEISKLGEVDAIATIIAGNGAGLIIRQARETGFTGQFYSSLGLYLSPGAIAAAGDHLNGTYYQTYDLDRRFDDDFRARYGKDSTQLNVNGYTDMELLSYAIEKTGSTDGEKILSFIKGLGTFKGKYETVKIDPNGDMIIYTVVKKWGGSSRV